MNFETLTTEQQRSAEDSLYAPKLRVIGILGAARSGKSTASGYLQQVFCAQPESFAAPLKAGLNAMGLPYDEQVAYKSKIHPTFGKTSREIMQTLGTEWGRNMVSPDFWVIAMRKRLEGRSGMVVFDDVRFQNELDLIEELGGITIKIRRKEVEPGPVDGVMKYLTLARVHPSEQLWITADTDYEIDNNGTEWDLKVEVCKIINKSFPNVFPL